MYSCPGPAGLVSVSSSSIGGRVALLSVRVMIVAIRRFCTARAVSGSTSFALRPTRVTLPTRADRA